jgi:hypothetical protein
MPDIALPVSPLAHVLTPGRYGRALPEGPGVTLSSVHPCEIVSVIAAKGKARALAMAMKKDFGVALPGMGESTSARGLTLVGVQPDGWLALQPGGSNLADGWKTRPAGIAMVTSQSHGRTLMRIAGPARATCWPRARRPICIRPRSSRAWQQPRRSAMWVLPSCALVPTAST